MKVGLDIQDISRIKRLPPERMVRIFSARELLYIQTKNSAQTVAGLFCAKEAFFKALGCGVKHNKLTDVEILHDECGAPYYNILDDELKNLAPNTTLSISHTKNTAAAVCVVF